MELVNIRENALTVDLDWADCTLLAHLIKRALENDALHDADNWTQTHGYARTIVALLEAGGMATWAHTTSEEEYTLEDFRAVAPVTAKERAKEEARIARARRQLARRQPATPPGDHTAPAA
ncbi:MAG: hypothetical protein M3Q65_14600 [Chloroflexota bacterium]|nr:hypothetical protein [Chloroflexota bacterium]